MFKKLVQVYGIYVRCIIILFAIELAVVVAHESAHAITAYTRGVSVTHIRIGGGITLYDGSFLTIGLSPFHGGDTAFNNDFGQTGNVTGEENIESLLLISSAGMAVTIPALALIALWWRRRLLSSNNLEAVARATLLLAFSESFYSLIPFISHDGLLVFKCVCVLSGIKDESAEFWRLCNMWLMATFSLWAILKIATLLNFSKVMASYATSSTLSIISDSE